MTNSNDAEVSGTDRGVANLVSTRRTLGIGGKLLLAFSMIACFTVLATVIVWFIFGHIRDNLTIIVNQSMPSIVASFRLVEESAQLSAAIPRLANATEKQQAEAEARSIEVRLKAIARYTEQLKQGDESSALVRDFERIGQDVRSHVWHLRAAVEEGLAATQERETALATLFNYQDDFTFVVEPAIAKARDEVVLSTEKSVANSTARVSALIDGSVETLRAVLEIQSSINLLIAVMNQVAATDDLKFLSDRRFAIVGPIADIRSGAGQIPETKESQELMKVANDVIDLAITRNGIFTLRRSILTKSSADKDVLRKKLSQRISALNKAQESFLRLSRHMIEAVDTKILETAGTASRESQRVITTTRDGIDRLKMILLMHSETNQLASLLKEVGAAPQRYDIAASEQRYTILAKSIRDRLRRSESIHHEPSLRSVVENIIDIGHGEKSMFAIRKKELKERGEAAHESGQTRELAGEWLESAQLLVESAGHAAGGASTDANTSLVRGQWVLVAIAVTGLIAAVLIAWLYVFRFIVRRLTGLSSTMLAIADGDLDAAITVEGQDEVTDMGRALIVFRDNALKRRDAERALRDSEERYALAIQGSTDALWDTDLRTGTTYYSERYWTMLGYDHEDIAAGNMTTGTRDNWERNVHPEDLPGVIERLQAHLSGNRQTHEATYRFQRKDGSWCWVHSRGRAIFDEDNIPYRLTGTLTDITERVELENELRLAKEEAEQALAKLKATQASLIQAEKMASLGQLTAGIAHEIKNPLNFVNNFSKLSIGLIEDVREQMTEIKAKIDGQTREEIDETLEDLTLNLDKIHEHGQRADSIVRGMLEHSREASGEMQPTDINALLNEFASLAFHGMRAQTEGFNVTLNTDYEENLAPIEVIPQDLSRVFLNIVTNAFQAVHERHQQAGDGFDPAVWLSTKRSGNGIEIRIRDNGLGMPKEVSDRVFQPFFTTKAPGEGTGLGLSISYDIVVQEHQGRLTVESEEGEYTEFVIQLPEHHRGESKPPSEATPGQPAAPPER